MTRIRLFKCAVNDYENRWRASGGQTAQPAATRRAHAGRRRSIALTMSNSGTFQSVSIRHSSCWYDGFRSFAAALVLDPEPAANSLLTGKITGNCNCLSTKPTRKSIKFITLAYNGKAAHRETGNFESRNEQPSVRWSQSRRKSRSPPNTPHRLFLSSAIPTAGHWPAIAAPSRGEPALASTVR